MGVLDRATRQQLLTALESMPILDAANGRTLLLQDLPPALAAAINRDDATAIDLANIINACDAWGTPALRTMIENALSLIAGSVTAEQLQKVLNTLPAGPLSENTGATRTAGQGDLPAAAQTSATARATAVSPPIGWNIYALVFGVSIFLTAVTQNVGSSAIDPTHTTFWATKRVPADAENFKWTVLGIILALIASLCIVLIINFVYKLTWQLSLYTGVILFIGANVGEGVFRFLREQLIDPNPVDPLALVLFSSVCIVAGALIALVIIDVLKRLRN